MIDTEAQPPAPDPSASQPTPAPIAEPSDLDQLEQRPVPGFPMVTIWRSEFNALIGEIRSLRARVGSEDAKFVYDRIGKTELDRLRGLLTHSDRDQLTTWEVVEIAADELT